MSVSIIVKVALGVEGEIPPFVIFASSVCYYIELTLKVLCTLDTMVRSEARLVFVGDKCLQLRESLRAAEVGMDLIEVAV